MSLPEAVRRLTAARCLDELHHLFTTEPSDTPDQGWDLGWCCRSHALMGGVVAGMCGLACSVVHGEAHYILGPVAGSPLWGVCVEKHAWLDVPGCGAVDLSPRLDRCRIPPNRPWPLQCIAAGRCLPTGLFQATDSWDDYQRRVDQACRTEESCCAIYFIGKRTKLDRALWGRLLDLAHSPLSARLGARYGPDIYTKAAVHIFHFLRDEETSLRHLSQDEAWEVVARQSTDVIARSA